MRPGKLRKHEESQSSRNCYGAETRVWAGLPHLESSLAASAGKPLFE
jgi:hypothetical protein